MVTDAIIYWTLKFLRFAIHIRDVYMLTAPFFASNTMIVSYFFRKELRSSGAGLVATALIAICSGYISRSGRIDAFFLNVYYKAHLKLEEDKVSSSFSIKPFAKTGDWFDEN
ncbi:hypothetical protein L1887_21347 [Cichorium endivia]|nr:hypothetical protein L1887_21347 [Cichorium endivia]